MWELTRACKLSCLHCPVGAQQRRSPLELSTYEAYKTIDQIAQLRPDEFIITGGDPLERSDIHQLIEYATRRWMRPSLTVSPTPALTGSEISKLRRNGLSRVIFSLDAPTPERHDAVRGLHGQFSATLQAVRWARTAGLATEVNTLVTKHNAGELEVLARFLADLGTVRWNVFFVVPTGGAKTLEVLPAQDVEAVFDRLMRISLDVPFEIRTFEAPHYRRYVLLRDLARRQESVDRFFESDSPDDLLLQQRATQRATADRDEMLFISHTGEVTISPFLPLTAGNVRYLPLTALHRNGEIFAALRDEANLHGKCGRCEFRVMCGGSRARAYAMTGDVFAADPLCGYEPGNFSTDGRWCHDRVRPETDPLATR
jgi:AdoMet-dependent heme synthase